MKNTRLIKALTVVFSMILVSSGWGFETNVDSEVKGADLKITKDGNDGGDLTVEGQLKIESVDTTSSGVVTTIDIATTVDDNKLPTVDAVRNLKVPAFCASHVSSGEVKDTVIEANGFFPGSDSVNGGFDTTNNYDSGNGEFKAPLAGIYQFTWTALANQPGRTALYKNDSIYIQTSYGGSDNGYNGVRAGHSLSALVKLNENDTVNLAGVSAESFAKMKYYADSGHNMFCGYLVQLTN
jgi:hypothetical protein